MAGDYAGDASTRGFLPVTTSPNSISGVLDPNGDFDWFAVNLSAGLLYQFDLTYASNFVRPSNLDETLIDASAAQIAATGTTDKTFQYVPSNSGTYYVQVNSRNSGGYGSGSYTLTAGTLDDYTADTTTTARLTIGGSLDASLERANDSDWVAVNLTAGFNYRFVMAPAADFTRAANSFINLRDSNGVLKTGNTLYTRDITFTPTAGGTHYLAIGSNGGGGYGSYSLTSIGDDYTNTTATTGKLQNGSSATGTLEGSGDDDWFAVTLTAGKAYSFSLNALASLSPASNLYMRLLNSNSSQLQGGGTVARPLTFTPTATGTYYLEVSAGDTTGSYRISDTTIYPTANTGGGTTGPGSGTTNTGGANGTATTTTPVYRFFDSKFGTHFFTSNSTERDTIIATRPDLVSEGVGLSALGQSGDGNVSAVFRFFDTIHGTQFVTAATTERDTILATRSDLKLEGVSFYEYNNAVPGSAPVYRFFDTIYGTHFFTGSASERATIVATRSDLVEEGIAFYSPAT